MKIPLLLSVLILINSPVMGQWRAVHVSSKNYTGDIEENFRRASLWSNRKLDRFSNDTLYGQPIFQNGVKFGDGTIQNTAGDVLLASTQTFTGSNSFTAPTLIGSGTVATATLTIQSTTTTTTTPVLEVHANDGSDILHIHQNGSSVFSGDVTILSVIDTGIVIVSSTGLSMATLTATCPANKYAISGSCYETNGAMRMCGQLVGDHAWPWTSWSVTGNTTNAYREVTAICARIK